MPVMPAMDAAAQSPTGRPFGKAKRIRRRGEFTDVFDRGHRASGRFLTLLILPNTTGRPRLGIVASRKVGDAVRRNRAKRLIREVFRHAHPESDERAFDIVVLPRREFFEAPYQRLAQDYQSALRRCAQLLASGAPPAPRRPPAPRKGKRT